MARAHANTELVISTDGSSLKNGKKGAAAGVGVFFGHGDPRNAALPLVGRPTNQRAELEAVRIALARVRLSQDVLIRTDSQYAIGCITEWYEKWQWESFKQPKGYRRENEDIIKKILKRTRKREVLGARTRYVWVKGHAGDEGNEEADKLAKKGAQKSQLARIRKDARLYSEAQERKWARLREQNRKARAEKKAQKMAQQGAEKESEKQAE